MRVVGGVAKGRRLRSPRGKNIRPVTDALKESIFNILGERVAGRKILDLYAGTGSLGIEALSRGAGWVLFVDQSREAVRLIEENLKALGFEDRARVWQEDVAEALKRLGNQSLSFDLIFVDPPYGEDLCASTLLQLRDSGITADGGEVVLRRHRKEVLSPVIGELTLSTERRSGEAVIDFFRFATRS